MKMILDVTKHTFFMSYADINAHMMKEATLSLLPVVLFMNHEQVFFPLVMVVVICEII